MPRIHILGASGSGTTTLGGALADALGIPHTDSDDIFWLPTDPPFARIRPLDERLSLLKDRLRPGEDWVFSGSATVRARPVEQLYELIVYLHLDQRIRLNRLRAREAERYGARILPGGDMAEGSAAFITWAAAYDAAGPEQRSRAGHEAWLASQAVPVIRLDTSRPLAELVRAVLAEAS